MKTTKVLQAISLFLIFVIAVSCRSNRSTTGRQYPRNPTPTETPTKTTPVYVEASNLPPGQAKKIYGSQSAKAYAPGQQKKYANRYPLIIVHTPGIVINKYSDGRYYYRNTAGYTYWKGYDGRYYIDEKHLKGMEYEVSEYDDWKFKGQKNDKTQGRKGQEQEEKLKENQIKKDAKDIAKVKEQKENGQNQKAKDNEQKGNGQNPKAEEEEQKGNGQNQKAKDNDSKGKERNDQKAKDNDSKEKDQTDEKAKDDNTQKGKAKSKDKG